MTFRRLDAKSPVITTDHANWAYADRGPFITTGIRTPLTTGCWEITGKLKSEEVKYVVWLGGK